MSTALKQQSSAISRAPTPDITRLLIADSAIGSDDRVVVVGQGSIDHLIGLVRTGCKSAATLSPHALGHTEDAADVVWLTGVDSVDDDLAATVAGLGTPRVVAIEFTRDGANLSALLGQLRAKGLVNQTVHRTGGAAGGMVVTATRPAWLRRVIGEAAQ